MKIAKGTLIMAALMLCVSGSVLAAMFTNTS
jgi:hypothetical protein